MTQITIAQPNRTVTKKRTEVLVRINLLLRKLTPRAYLTTRDPIKRSFLSNYLLNELAQIENIDVNRIELLRQVPEKYKNEDVPVCVCRLAECCDFENCIYCLTMMDAADFEPLDRTVWLTQRTPVEVSVFENGSKVVPIQESDQRSCLFGDNCRYFKLGCCRFKH